MAGPGNRFSGRMSDTSCKASRGLRPSYQAPRSSLEISDSEEVEASRRAIGIACDDFPTAFPCRSGAAEDARDVVSSSNIIFSHLSAAPEADEMMPAYRRVPNRRAIQADRLSYA